MAFDRYQLLADPIAAGTAGKKVDVKEGKLLWEVRVLLINSAAPPVPPLPFLQPQPQPTSVEHFIAAGDTELELHASICGRADGTGVAVGDLQPVRAGSTPPAIVTLKRGVLVNATNGANIAVLTA
jgi:hypothetical protein